MIVACPNCQTQFEFDASRVTAASIKLKCSRCRAVFPAPFDKKQVPPASTTKKRTRPAVDSLALPFDEPDWKDGETSEQLAVPDRDEPYTLGMDDRDSPATEAHMPLAIQEEPPESQPPLPSSMATTFADDEDEIPDEQDFEDEPPASEDSTDGDRDAHRAESGMVWTILGFLVLVLAGYAGLTGAFFADPAWCDDVLGRLPFVAGNNNDRLLTRKIALAEVAGSHQAVKDDKNVFVLSGKAYNTSAEPMVNVQIVGTLFDATGKEVGRKAIHLGNIISTKVLSEMTRKEIEVFHNLNVSWRNIEPGQSYPFVIVFTDPPKNAIDFTVKVNGAFRQRS